MTTTLTKDEIHEVQSTAETTGQDPSNKRAQPRREYLSETHVFLISDAVLQVIPIMTRELSQGGIGFLSLFPFQPDQEFILALPRPGGIMAAHCRVRHARPDAGGCFLVGASFEEIHKHLALPCAIKPKWLKIVNAIINATNKNQPPHPHHP